MGIFGTSDAAKAKKARDAIMRQQFAKLPKAENEWQKAQRKVLEKWFVTESNLSSHYNVETAAVAFENTGQPLDEIAVDENGIKLTWRDLAAVITSRSRPTSRPRVLDAYAQMICQYINTVRGGGTPILSCATLSTQDIHALVFKNRDQHSAPIINQVLGCINCTGYNFYNLDYLFVPAILWGHAFLMGISPRQRFVFVLDSVIGGYWKDRQPVLSLLQILISQDKSFVQAADNKNPTPHEWRLYSQFPQRSETMDDSPNAAQQRDNYNCAIFAATNCMCLAFGYDLTCYTQSDLDSGKKPRMTAEFKNGGFSGAYTYDVLPYPIIAGQSGGGGVQRRPTIKAPKVEPTIMAPKKTGKDDSAQAGFLEYAEVLDEEMADVNIDTRFEGSNGESEEVLHASGIHHQPLYTRSQLLHAFTNPAPPRRDTTPFPAQFSPTLHQAAGFFYGPPDFWNVQKRAYSTRELKNVCRDFGLKDWKEQSREEAEFFRRWVFTSCGAVMSRIRGNEMQPFLGIGETTLDLEALKEGRIEYDSESGDVEGEKIGDQKEQVEVVDPDTSNTCDELIRRVRERNIRRRREGKTRRPIQPRSRRNKRRGEEFEDLLARVCNRCSLGGYLGRGGNIEALRG